MRKLSQKLVPKSILKKKSMVINRFGKVCNIPEDVILLIKEFLFYELAYYKLHWSYQESIRICSWNRYPKTDTIYVLHALQDNSPVDMIQWSYYYHTKNIYIQLQSIMCSICGNYYHNGSDLIRNQVRFTHRIRCHCEFDYGDNIWNNDWDD